MLNSFAMLTFWCELRSPVGIADVTAVFVLCALSLPRFELSFVEADPVGKFLFVFVVGVRTKRRSVVVGGAGKEEGVMDARSWPKRGAEAGSQAPRCEEAGSEE
jgi:hypothetical protein